MTIAILACFPWICGNAAIKWASRERTHWSSFKSHRGLEAQKKLNKKISQQNRTQVPKFGKGPELCCRAGSRSRVRKNVGRSFEDTTAAESGFGASAASCLSANEWSGGGRAVLGNRMLL